MGIIGAATGLGFIFGPAIGGVFSKSSLSTPFYIAGVVAVITLVFVIFILKESLPLEKRVQHAEKKDSIWKDFKGPLTSMYMLQLIITLSMAGLETTFAYFAAQKAEYRYDSIRLYLYDYGIWQCDCSRWISGSDDKEIWGRCGHTNRDHCVGHWVYSNPIFLIISGLLLFS